MIVFQGNCGNTVFAPPAPKKTYFIVDQTNQSKISNNSCPCYSSRWHASKLIDRSQRCTWTSSINKSSWTRSYCWAIVNWTRYICRMTVFADVLTHFLFCFCSRLPGFIRLPGENPGTFLAKDPSYVGGWSPNLATQATEPHAAAFIIKI